MIDLDPRSADYPEDSAYWQKVLTRAAGNDDLFTLLRIYRDYGAKLVELRHGGYGLRPRYLPEGGWGDQDEWDRDRTQWLMPVKSELAEVLA